MYQASVLLDSVAPNGIRLTTLEVTYPRIILPEMNTHCILSKNTSSSRAMPFSKLLEQVESDPYIPLKWVRKAKGMQGTVEMTELEVSNCKAQYLQAMEGACNQARLLDSLGCFKEIPNRLIEPFAWTKQVISGTQWANFFTLRTDNAAHHAMQKIARMMYLAYRKSKPNPLGYAGWHLPYITNEDWAALNYDLPKLQMVSVARCARVSYWDFEGKKDYFKDFDLYNMLLTSKHMSPFQHQAEPGLAVQFAANPKLISNFKGWIQYRKLIPGECFETFNPTEEELVLWENQIYK